MDWHVYAVFYIISLVNAGSADNCGVSFKDNGICACSMNSGNGAVSCYDNQTIEIQPCYCMYYDAGMNLSVVGNCYYSCYEFDNTLIEVSSSQEFNAKICDQYGTLHRTGRFCGQCNENYSLPVYSYEIFSCVPCEDYGYKNWLKYFAVALLPLTVFYILAVLLSFNVTSSSFSGILVVIQCITSPAQMNIIASNPYVSRQATLAKLVISIACMVNLDFFRMVYTPVCLHPKANILEILSLDYIIALYPFLLIFLTYVLVTAYDREYRLLRYMWKPFKWCFNYYRKTWNIKTSLIEIFATFIFFSSVKILGVSFQILSFTTMQDVERKINKVYYLYNGTIEFFGEEHLPYAVLAIIVSFIFVFFPLLLLTVYPCHCFQRCLNRCGRRSQPLHVFMDAFQGCYRTHPRDLRYFSAFFLLLRVLLLAQVVLFPTYVLLFNSGVLSFAGAAVVAVLQPYKVKSHNTVDTVLLLLMGVYFTSYYDLILLTSLNYQLQWLIAAICQGFSIAFLILYLISLLLWKLLRFKLLALIRRARSAWSSRNIQRIHTTDFINSFDGRRDSDTNIYPQLLGRSVMPTY